MEIIQEKKDIEVGRYKHYKGKNYDVYCIALDRMGNQFVLYRQGYGDKSFWLRPYDMFFESVFVNGQTLPRFSYIRNDKITVEKKIQELIQLIQKQAICIKNSENEQRYFITNIDISLDYVLVHPVKNIYSSGYLTEFELTERMGIISCRINSETHYFKSDDLIKQNEELQIGDNEIDSIKKIINPCSIDLQISDSGFLSTKLKLVDPQSIEHVSSATELWKKVKVYRSKNQSSAFFKLYPGKTILTHTKERIRIPKDCAGKVEIKSTFARLSLTITSGDFCNPGYDGYFPLEITNNGKHTIIIHNGETMAQLMLIPLQGPILEDYAAKATYKNDEGYDDGTPYTFWRERSIKALRKESGTQQIIDLSQRILKTINSQNTSDVNEFRERFENNFLPYCQKHISKSKYQNQDTGLPDANIILNAYVKKEKRLKSFFSMKWASGILTAICALLPVLFQYLQNKQEDGAVVSILAFWPWFLVAGLLLVVTILLAIASPKTFCTFEEIDLKKMLAEIS